MDITESCRLLSDDKISIHNCTYLFFLHHAAGVSFSSSAGFTLAESPTPYEICVNISESPSEADLNVSITAVEFLGATCK